VIYPLTVQAERLADKPAVIEDRPGRAPLVWSYAELNRQANRLAHVFRDLGLEPGERFIWCGPNSPALVAVGHARAKVGATAVPLNYRLTPEETAYIVEDSDAVLIYADAEHAETFARIRPQMKRVRHIVIYGGLYPAEIEAALERHPAVQEVAVFGIPSDEWGEAVHAVVVVRAGEALVSEGLLAFGRERLAGYKVPRSVSFADELPKTGSGKILKRSLREPFWQGRSRRVG